MNGTEKLKERQMENRQEYRKNAINVPICKDEKERIVKAARHLGLTNAGFLRMAARKYIDEMGIG